MKQLVKKVVILSPGKIFDLEPKVFYHSILNKLETYWNTPIPGLNTKINSPAIEAQFDLSIFVQEILARNKDTAQIIIVCHGVHISLEELCGYLLAGPASELRAKMTPVAHP